MTQCLKSGIHGLEPGSQGLVIAAQLGKADIHVPAQLCELEIHLVEPLIHFENR